MSQKQDEKQLTITLQHNEHTGNFFVDFAEQSKTLASIKLTEPQILWLSEQLGIKIFQ
jgi:hypothetical protein